LTAGIGMSRLLRQCCRGFPRPDVGQELDPQSDLRSLLQQSRDCRLGSGLASLPGKDSVGYPPDRAVGILGNQQRAIMGDGHADRPPPDLLVVDDKARDEVLIFAARHAVLQTDANDLVTSPLRPVPGPVLGRESIAAILRREIAALIEGHAE